MSSSSSSPAPVSSAKPPPSCAISFPETMAGKAVRMVIPFHEGTILDPEGWSQEPPTLVKIKTHPRALLLGETLLLERKGGLFFEGVVEFVDEAPDSAYETTASIRVKEDTVRCCKECKSDRVPAPTLGATIRFSRPDPRIIEATVRKVERRESSALTIVELQALSAPPPDLLSIGDTVILETMDSLHHWEGDVRCYVDPTFFGSTDPVGTMSIFVRDDQVPMHPKLLQPPLLGINIQPAPPARCDIKFTRSGATSKKARKKSSKDDRAKPKIKVGVNIVCSGYENIARAVVKVTLESQDVELVAINDPSITRDHMSCMYKDHNLHGHWKRSDFRSNGADKLLFGVQEVTLFRNIAPKDIDWYQTGAEFIVEIHPSICQSAEEYKTYAEDASGSSSNAHTMNFDPLQNIFDARLGSRVFSPIIRNSWRTPILQIYPVSSSATKAIIDLLPSWNCRRIGKIFHVPAAEALDITFVLFKYGGLVLSNTKPSVDFGMFIGWCFEMILQIPEVWWCEATMATASQY